MTEKTCQTSQHQKILNPELHEIISVNYMKLQIWLSFKVDAIHSEMFSPPFST